MDSLANSGVLSDEFGGQIIEVANQIIGQINAT